MISKAGKILGGIVGLILLFIVAGFVVQWVKFRYDNGVIERFTAIRGIQKRDTVIKVLDSTRVVREVVYLRDKATAQQVIASPTSTKPEVIRACNQVILSCDAVRAINDTLRDSLTAQIKALRKLKEAKPPRLSAFALMGYDWMNAAPLAQVGGDARILGPLSITGYVEGSKLAAEKMQARGVVGVKFTFR